MTVHIGLWAIPLAVTIASFALAVLVPLPRSACSFNFEALASAYLRGAGVSFVSIVAWFIWALVR